MSGDMMWYEGPGVYCDCVKIAEFSVAELVELLLQHDYTIIREDKQEQDQ